MSAVSVIPVSVLSLLLLAPSLQAMDAAGVASHGAVKESRYVSHRVGATAEQMDVMQSVVRTTIPDQIKTVGAALGYLLKPYGYQLDDEDDEPKSLDFYLLLTRPLPESHRTIDPMTLNDALAVLGGDSFDVIINPVLRTVRYRLKSGLQDYVSEADRNRAQAIWLTSVESGIGKAQKAPVPMEVFGYGPVQSGDTLSDIVLQFGMVDLTLDQVLVHAFHTNPDAFAGGNMNHLIVGAYLSIPSFSSEKLSPIEASRVVDKHYRRWLQQVQP